MALPSAIVALIETFAANEADYTALAKEAHVPKMSANAIACHN